ncbi:MAG: HGGxSTG domain-containing protein [Betaproteobacteria bacterium]
MDNLEKMIVLAGGRITCLRCTARAKSSQAQCRKAALRISRTQKCRLHGGKSKGPVTAEGKRKSAIAPLKTGRFTKEAILRDSSSRVTLRQLRDAMVVLAMAQGMKKLRGRKPAAYIPIETLQDVWEMKLRDALQRMERVKPDEEKIIL